MIFVMRMMSLTCGREVGSRGAGQWCPRLRSVSVMWVVCRRAGLGARRWVSGGGATPPSPAAPSPAPLTAPLAHELALRLTGPERTLLLDALHRLGSEEARGKYEGQLAAHKWRSKFGRPSNVVKLGDVDPTGSYCPVPDDWVKLKQAEKIPVPSSNDLFHLMITNSIPFIGFGFLDNFIMIVAGDYIDHMLGAYICLSTMAAAALGNTFSDVIGIGSAYYVERFAEKIGFRPPNLNPIQLDMLISRRISNLGRVLGITIGCILGMFPLLFLKDQPKPTPNISKEVLKTD